jgi:hypothetical protein
MDQQLLDTLRVIALPMKSKFRGITVREVALIKGPYGWGEFSPFLEYEDEESAHWLASAVEAATTPGHSFFAQLYRLMELFQHLMIQLSYKK